MMATLRISSRIMGFPFVSAHKKTGFRGLSPAGVSPGPSLSAAASSFTLVERKGRAARCPAARAPNVHGGEKCGSVSVHRSFLSFSRADSPRRDIIGGGFRDVKNGNRPPPQWLLPLVQAGIGWFPGSGRQSASAAPPPGSISLSLSPGYAPPPADAPSFSKTARRAPGVLPPGGGGCQVQFAHVPGALRTQRTKRQGSGPSAAPRRTRS